MKSRSFLLALFVAALAAGSAHAALNTNFDATPGSGAAPLPVTFTYTGGEAGVTFLWDFGDGSISSSPNPVHTYNTGGTFEVTLTLSNGTDTDTSAPLPITVTGAGEGPVTPGLNFRWAPITSNFKTVGAGLKDSFTLKSTFSTVDLPSFLVGVPFAFYINGELIVTDVLNADGIFTQSANALRPGFKISVSKIKQTLDVTITKADLSTALPGSPPPDTVTLKVTLGAQTYEVNLGYEVKPVGLGGTGKYKLAGPTGFLIDGFLVIKKAGALEDDQNDGHFWDITALIVRPNGDPFTLPPVIPDPGVWKIQIGNFIDVIQPDRVRLSTTKLLMTQPDRDKGGASKIILDLKKNQIRIKTWDLDSEGAGGTGLPLRGQANTGFDAVLRLDLEPDPLGGTFDFQGVTATRLTRKNTADAFWATGR
ncbi:MAG: PKD domain-containing protein [Planctomycetes bacterium]|nr:PKD domain-containing protein [Planctomycetota bacterium]